MILADSNIWIDHIRRRDPVFSRMVEDLRILMHPFVIGEVALGRFTGREFWLEQMAEIEQAVLATDDEVLVLIDRLNLTGTGIGLVDAHLLASTFVTVDARLWTRDKRLAAIAQAAGIKSDLN